MKRSLRSWLWRVPSQDEVDEELALHVEMRRREGRPLDDADVARVRRACLEIARRRDRQMRLTQWLGERGTDVRFAVRQLRKAPAFTAVAVLTLALGIGANSAMFALADAALLRPLPFGNPDRLVMVWERRPSGVETMGSPAEARAWTERNRTLAAVASLAAGGTVTIPAADGAGERLPSQTVSARFFDVLGVTPLAGRTFVAADVTPVPHVIVLSEPFWRRRFAANPSIVGREIALNGQAHTVVGVVPANVQLVPPFSPAATAAGDAIDVWVLAGFGANAADNAHFVHVIARLKPGVTLEAATADLAGISREAERLRPEAGRGHGVMLQPLRDALIGREVRLTSTVLLGVVGFVLMMCCANVANLLLARTSARGRELAVRSALGAGRRRIAAQLLTESVVIAVFGGVLGAGLGMAVLRSAPALIPPGLLPNTVALAFDGRVVAFCAVTALSVGLLFGLAPAWHATGTSLVQAVASTARSTRRGSWLRGVLVAGEVAAAVLVLAGAGLLLRTWLALGNVEPGSQTKEALALTINLPFPNAGVPGRFDTPAALHRFYDAVEQEVSRVPGVRRVAWGNALPLDGFWFFQAIEIAGDPPRPDGTRANASYHMVTPSYFETLGIPIVGGRAFAAADTAQGPPVCIVSEAFVQQFLGGRQPIGMRVRVPLMAFGRPAVVEREIVGVARQVTGQASEPRPAPQIYVPLTQNIWWGGSLVVTPAGGSAEALVPAVRAAIARVDKEALPRQVRTFDVIAATAVARERFRAVLVMTFGVLALVLAMAGVFAVLAYAVQQRTREFGVRIALGAGRSDVLRLVLGSAVQLTAAGAVVGLLVAAALTRFIASLLFGVRPLDPVTFAGTAVVLGLAALAAAAAPALRACHVDPATAFRED